MAASEWECQRKAAGEEDASAWALSPSHVRAGLYMPVVSALRWNPTIRTFYQRLVAKGKTKMTALVAAMRKLLTILNLMIAQK